MKCPFCSGDLSWLNDWDLEEENEDEAAIQSSYTCRDDECPISDVDMILRVRG